VESRTFRSLSMGSLDEACKGSSLKPGRSSGRRGMRREGASVMPREQIERLAKTAASGQRTTPLRLSQRRVARHALQMVERGGARPLRLRGLCGISATPSIFYSRGMGGS